MFTAQNYIYIFGGLEGDGVTYLNDVWRFDVNTELWELVTVTGTVPEPRASPSCFQEYGLILVGGGYQGNTLYSDLYSFKPSALNGILWQKIKD